MTAVRDRSDSAADEAILDSLHQPGTSVLRSDTSAPPPAVRGEEVEREAVRLFGANEGRAVVGAAPSGEPTFDIDVTTFAANRRVLEYLEFFQVDAQDRFAIWLSRLGRYEGMIREQLRAKRLPEDLVYLALIESGLSNTAVSRARAVGMWQFMAATGRLYGLTVDPWVDERRDPYKATQAAVTYLADLRERLGGSVYLAAAAYNAGVGRVERGLNRLPGESDSVTDHTFFQLADRRYLRRETRDYVPKLIAASLIAKQPGRYGFDDIRPLAPLVFDEISVQDATGLDVLARLADTTVDALLELNPQFVRGITPPGRAITVRVPRGRGTQVAARYDTLPPTARITFIDHYVTRGQTLSDIARRYHVTVPMIQTANPSLKPHALKVGERIIIPMSGRVVPGGAWSVPPESRTRYTTRSARPTTTGRSAVDGGDHRVESGETLSEIARRYGVSLGALLDYNDLTTRSVIHAGQIIKIPPR
ncbi:MAG TPA: LysM peptidoglycan-binding domain-containing protein [Gemmatimonadales bacterium]|nr:LysM peptidoglycan-binding domain-containing protein [Gemmatimonadales bacterium]